MFISLNNIFAQIRVLNQENFVDALVGRLPSLHAWKKKHENVARESAEQFANDEEWKDEDR